MSDEMTTIKSDVHAELKQAKILAAKDLKEKGYSNVEIAKYIGISENTVRSLLET